MHEQLHALRMGIVVQGLDVKVRIWGDEVEDIILVAVGPVFPADVPAFHENLVETVLCGEVNVAADILIVRAMRAVRLAFAEISLAEMN